MIDEKNIILLTIIFAIFAVGYLVKYLVDKRSEKKRRNYEYD